MPDVLPRALPAARRALLTLLPLLILGCSTIDRAPVAPLDRSARWAVLPLANHTETPGAGQRAAAVIEGVLGARGIVLQRPPGTLGADSLFEPADAQAQLQDKALTWARGAGIRYAVTGSVTEWRYKVGVDGEPAVGLSLQVIDLTGGSTAWAATGARSGWSREALAAVAQKLVRELTEPLAR